MTKLYFPVLLLLMCSGLLAQPVVAVINKGHSHNDYEQAKPFHQALELGYRSIEADIWIYNGELVVSHDNKNLDKKKTLRELYLEPLKYAWQHPVNYKLDEHVPLVLMIDIKSDGEETYKLLRQLLKQYDPILTKYTADDVQKNLVAVLLSGSKPYDGVASDSIRYVTLDVDSKYSNLHPEAKYITRVSDNYKSHFKWDGSGAMPTDEHDKLVQLVNGAHLLGRSMRFWGGPDTPEAWKTLLDAGVDWINTDKLDEFQQFYIYYAHLAK